MEACIVKSANSEGTLIWRTCRIRRCAVRCLFQVGGPTDAAARRAERSRVRSIESCRLIRAHFRYSRLDSSLSHASSRTRGSSASARAIPTR